VSDPRTRGIIALVASIVGIALIVVGVVYLAETAHAIPSFFPGHEAAPTSHHHAKHGIAAILLGLAALALAWFQLGPKKRPAGTTG
jgi:hypothetical protein